MPKRRNDRGLGMIALGFIIPAFNSYLLALPFPEKLVVTLYGLSFAAIPFLLILGHSEILRARGQPGWLCLIGLLPLISLAIVYLLPDKNRGRTDEDVLETASDVPEPDATCPSCSQQLTVEEALDACSKSWPRMGWLQLSCPACGATPFVELVGEDTPSESTGRPAGSSSAVIRLSGVEAIREERGIRVRAVGREWLVPS